jgi:hypothetical protein
LVGTERTGGERDGFARAIAHLSAVTSPDDDLCAPFLDAVAVTGAVIPTLGHPLGSRTICASDDVAARIDEIQIDLGEGPCWHALRTRMPALEPDLRRSGGQDWPGAREALRRVDVGSLYAFPLLVGTLGVGSVDLYSSAPRALAPLEVDDVQTLAMIAAHHVLRRAIDDLDSAEQGAAGGPFSRRELHQATGMVAAQLHIGVDDALVLLRAHAFATDAGVRQVAADVVARRLSFGP